ncbi:hypothetical protein FIT78_00705 [Candidatus Methylopumilus universalis]|uniref:hypothetical protein n=1 Tax=Candidatus Methylopumilus universalis TaxID=2588536 RepID=UPI00112361F6|nr:hypothetical protein [Candidatus Methylopumilus universalis]QDC97164.1 hypothetical protein FIT78_00705 [Candidatus Methylopumilus universalis]
MKRFLLILITLLISSSAYTLEVYSCPDEHSASNCSSCKKTGSTTSFKINIENQVVIETINNGYSKGVSELARCSVADKRNWICKSTLTNGTLLSKQSMSEGVFVQIVYREDRSVMSSHCAK